MNTIEYSKIKFKPWNRFKGSRLVDPNLPLWPSFKYLGPQLLLKNIVVHAPRHVWQHSPLLSSVSYSAAQPLGSHCWHVVFKLRQVAYTRQSSTLSPLPSSTLSSAGSTVLGFIVFLNFLCNFLFLVFLFLISLLCWPFFFFFLT